MTFYWFVLVNLGGVAVLVDHVVDCLRSCFFVFYLHSSITKLGPQF